MAIQLPQNEQDLEILQTEIKAIAGLLAQQDSISESISSRAKSVQEAVEGFKAADVKKLAKVFHLKNGQQLVIDAESLRDAVNDLFEGENDE